MRYLLRYIKLFFAAAVLYLCNSSCDKDYSYEGGGTVPVVAMPIDTTNQTDTNTTDPLILPDCSFCFDAVDIPMSSWSFKTGSSLVCGEVDTAILNFERNMFTFFGPSACGTDTGLIFSVLLGTFVLNRDYANLVAPTAIFYYYHTNQPFILSSQASQPFRLTITNYSHTTKVAAGTFSGIGFRADGRTVNVTHGKFKITLL